MRVSAEISFPLGRLLGQDMATMGLGTLELALSGAAKTFRGAAVGF